MIDIHSHILPGVDDGAANLEESTAMAQAYVASGFTHVFATPHHIPGTAWSVSSKRIRQEVQSLQLHLQENDINLTIHPGMEIAIHYHIGKELAEHQLLPLGETNCYLLEPPFQMFRDDLIDTLLSFKNLQNNGRKKRNIILAHPERIPFFQEKKELLIELKQEGVMLQINLGSLLGRFGRQALSTALYLMEHDCIHFVASDTHGSENRMVPTIEDLQQLEQLLGSELTKTVCYDNPARLIR